MSDPRLRWVSARIVRMFELYARNIDPDDEHFQAFIKNYVATKNGKGSESMPYSELYKTIKEGIREYLRQNREKQEK
jgi:hypothetical protein